MKPTRRQKPGRVPPPARNARPASDPSPASFVADERAARTGIAVLLAATALVYSRSLANGFAYDQQVTLTDNRLIGQWSFIWKSLTHDEWWFYDPRHLPQSSYYRPLPSIWVALNFHLFGLHPWLWHMAMAALHLAVVWLVYRVALRLADDALTALAAAALFAFSPLNAEAVIFAFSPPIVAAFELGAFAFYLARANSRADDVRRVRWMALSLSLFGAAVLTHESAVVLPALIGTHAYLFGRRDTRARTQRETKAAAAARTAEKLSAAISAAWPYALEVGAYLCLRLWVLGFSVYPNSLNRSVALGSLLRIPAAIVEYLTLLAMPWRAAPAHALTTVGGIGVSGFLEPCAFLALAGTGGYLLLRRNPRRRLYLFCSAWFLIALAPMLNVLADPRAQSIIHDRYVYLPSVGLYLIVADIAVRFARRRHLPAFPVTVAAAGLLAAEAALLFQTQHFWHDDITLFRACIENSPNEEIWHNRLGIALYANGDFAEARREFDLARKLNPRDGWNYYNMGRIDENLVRLTGKIEDAQRAESELTEGIMRMPVPPLEAYGELAMSAAVAGDRKAAEAALERADKVEGGADLAATARAQVNFWYHNYPGVEAAMREMLKREPDNPQALVILGRALSEEHRNAEAIAVLEHAASVAPSDSSLHYVVAYGLHELGRDEDARKECTIALGLAPMDPRVRALMAALGGAPHKN
ncbi:MAG TPA: tetratricopeptide repeat protein [Candidatus Binataceae bacterium]|nr:tetratricopeptide repeat protein [Candidatus Binataceae bacterium]